VASFQYFFWEGAYHSKHSHKKNIYGIKFTCIHKVHILYHNATQYFHTPDPYLLLLCCRQAVQQMSAPFTAHFIHLHSTHVILSKWMQSSVDVAVIITIVLVEIPWPFKGNAGYVKHTVELGFRASSVSMS
jgi:hypothetical protein